MKPQASKGEVNVFMQVSPRILGVLEVNIALPLAFIEVFGFGFSCVFIFQWEGTFG
jgi:hypothetical protein